MAEVTVSSKYQVVIPKQVREQRGLVSGQKLQVIVLDHRIELVSIRAMRELRGFARGISTEIERDEDRV